MVTIKGRMTHLHTHAGVALIVFATKAVYNVSCLNQSNGHGSGTSGSRPKSNQWEPKAKILEFVKNFRSIIIWSLLC